MQGKKERESRKQEKQNPGNQNQGTQNQADLGLGGGSLMQIAHRTLTQMMSYLIDTPDGQVIMIDGGNDCEEDAQNLYRELTERGGKVALWLITHAHSDHCGALLHLMENMPEFDIQIDQICLHFPDWTWLSGKEEADINARFITQLQEKGIPIYTPEAGEVLTVGGMEITIISVPEEYTAEYSINATSMIFTVRFPAREVLFLGDFDVSGQAEFLRKHDPQLIRKDIVQMAHHGQGGVDEFFYGLIRPKICLYTAPQWLWENNRYRCTDPATAGTGPFTIMETRRWMEKLGVEASYTHAEGDWLFL